MSIFDLGLKIKRNYISIIRKNIICNDYAKLMFCDYQKLAN